MIIGLTGKNCSGKDTVANYLIKKGFISLSLSDVIRDELKKLNIEITRENLIHKANELRTTKGANYLAKKCSEKLNLQKDYVIISIRNPEELKELRKLENFKLFNITASDSLRFERMRSRAREGDPKTFDKFLQIEKIELKNDDPNAQQLSQVMNLSDITIENDADLPALYSKIDKLLSTH